MLRAIQCKIVTENLLHLLLQQMFKMASLCMDTSREISSSLVNRFINNCLLYARSGCCNYTVKCLKITQSGLLQSFCC